MLSTDDFIRAVEREIDRALTEKEVGIIGRLLDRGEQNARLVALVLEEYTHG